MARIASRTAARSRISTACQRIVPSPGTGAVPGRCQATRSVAPAASRSRTWLPAKPAAPVTSVGRDIEKKSARYSAQPAVEGREIAQAGQREREEEAVIGRHGEGRQSLQIVLLVFEGQPAALRVVERRDSLLNEPRMQDIVVERVVRAVLV